MENIMAREEHRDVAVIAGEIREIKKSLNKQVLIHAVEIGRRLAEAKEEIPHGEWTDWLKREVDFSQSSANNFMRLFNEYGSRQISFFGAELNSQTFANLEYTKALALLALPSEEREAFVKTENPEEMSTRELQEAIRERNEERKKREAAEDEAEFLRQQVNDSEDALAEAERNLKKAEQDLAKAEQELAKPMQEDAEKVAEIQRLRAKVLEEEQKAYNAQLALESALKNPTIPEEMREDIKNEGRDEAVNELKEETDKALESAKAAKLALEAALKEKDEAVTRLRSAAPEMTEFKVLFGQLQETAKKMKAIIAGIEDAETAGKLKKALNAVAEILKED